MGRLERAGVPWSGLAGALAADEQPRHLFGCTTDGRPAVCAVTDRRVLVVAAGAVSARTHSVELGQIHQVDTTATGVTVRGSGVELKLSSVSRARQLGEALREARQ